jgi:hypothetical protein
LKSRFKEYDFRVITQFSNLGGQCGMANGLMKLRGQSLKSRGFNSSCPFSSAQLIARSY